MLKESLEKFVPPVYTKTARTPDTYKTVSAYCTRNLTRLVVEYNSVRNDRQLLREIRNDIDSALRRYHAYCIEERDGMQAHYHEMDADEEFESYYANKNIPANNIMYTMEKADNNNHKNLQI
jgi:hypothetical protein